MSFGVFIILGIVCLGIIWIWRKFYKHSQHENYEVQDNKIQIELVEELGQRIVNKIAPSLSKEITLDIYSSRPLEQSTLNIELVPLLESIVNIVVGKYKIEDLTTINYIKQNVERVLYYLSLSKNVDAIIYEYDPKSNNDLILEACRDLMDCQTIDDSKKILVAQYIVNKTSVGDELDHVYNYITSIALNRNISPIVRAEAADILSLSNSTRYMKIANQALELLRAQDNTPKRILRKPQGGQVTTHIARVPERVQTTRPPRRLGQTRLEQGERNDLFIIPPIIGRQDRDLQQVLWEQVGARDVPKTDRTVYEDNQSVHNSEINSSVLEAAKNLVSNYRTASMLGFDYSLLKDIEQDKRVKIEASIHRITTDSSIFKYGTTLHSIFQSLLQFISQSPEKNELNQRLIQELIDMSSLCASGHLSRLISVIQGFNIDEKLTIKISIDDELYAKVKHLAEQAIIEAENGDELLDNMTTDDKILIVDFLLAKAKEWLPEIYNEYNKITDKDQINNSLNKALDKFTKTSGKFKI